MKEDIAITQAITILNSNLTTLNGIYVFGSFATQTQTVSSDLDLAILPDTAIDPEALWSISTKIAHAINRNVDLIDLSQASTVFRAQIISTGIRVQSKNEVTCDNFEDLAYAMYIRLNDERQEILNDIKERGTIH
jgi:predicted nucleotidyltransferase